MDKGGKKGPGKDQSFLAGIFATEGSDVPKTEGSASAEAFGAERESRIEELRKKILQLMPIYTGLKKRFDDAMGLVEFSFETTATKLFEQLNALEQSIDYSAFEKKLAPILYGEDTSSMNLDESERIVSDFSEKIKKLTQETDTLLHEHEDFLASLEKESIERQKKRDLIEGMCTSYVEVKEGNLQLLTRLESLNPGKYEELYAKMESIDKKIDMLGDPDNLYTEMMGQDIDTIDSPENREKIAQMKREQQQLQEEIKRALETAEAESAPKTPEPQAESQEPENRDLIEKLKGKRKELIDRLEKADEISCSIEEQIETLSESGSVDEFSHINKELEKLGRKNSELNYLLAAKATKNLSLEMLGETEKKVNELISELKNLQTRLSDKMKKHLPVPGGEPDTDTERTESREPAETGDTKFSPTTNENIKERIEAVQNLMHETGAEWIGGEALGGKHLVDFTIRDGKLISKDRGGVIEQTFNPNTGYWELPDGYDELWLAWGSGGSGYVAYKGPDGKMFDSKGVEISPDANGFYKSFNLMFGEEFYFFEVKPGEYKTVFFNDDIDRWCYNENESSIGSAIVYLKRGPVGFEQGPESGKFKIGDKVGWPPRNMGIIQEINGDEITIAILGLNRQQKRREMTDETIVKKANELTLISKRKKEPAPPEEEAPESKNEKGLDELKQELDQVSEKYSETKRRWISLKRKSSEATRASHPRAKEFEEAMATIKPSKINKKDKNNLLETKILRAHEILLDSNPSEQSKISDLSDLIEDISLGIQRWNEAMEEVESNFSDIVESDMPALEPTEKNDRVVEDDANTDELLKWLMEHPAPPDSNLSRSFREILDRAKLANEMMLNRSENNVALAEIEDQLNYLKVDFIERNSPINLNEIIDKIIKGQEIKGEIEHLAQASGILPTEIRKILESITQEVNFKAAKLVRDGRSKSEKIADAGLIATKLIAYTTAGVTSGIYSLGAGTALSLAGVRFADRIISSRIGIEAKIKAKEKTLRKEILDGQNAEGQALKTELVKSLSMQIAMAQRRRINNTEKLDAKEFFTYNHKLAEECGCTTPEQLEQLVHSLEKLQEFDGNQGDSTIRKGIDWVSNLKAVKALNEYLLASGEKDSTGKAGVALLLSTAGVLCKGSKWVKAPLMALAGWKAGDFFGRLATRKQAAEEEMKKEKEKEFIEQQINQEKDAGKLLASIVKYNEEHAKLGDIRNKRLLYKFAGAVGLAGLALLIGYEHETQPEAGTASGHVGANPETTQDIGDAQPAETNPDYTNPETLKRLQGLDGARPGTAPLNYDPHVTGVAKAGGSPHLNKELTGTEEPKDFLERLGFGKSTDEEIGHAGTGTEAHHASGATGTTPTPETHAPAMTPDIKHQIELGTIHKGEGIEHSLIRQLKDPEIAKKLGFDPAKDGNINHWAGVKAHQIAIDKGYVGTDGQEIRVGTAGIDKASYVLETDSKGNVSIREYFDGKSSDFHSPHSDFEKPDTYEYKYGKGGSIEHQADHSAETTSSHSAGKSTSETLDKATESLGKGAKALSPNEVMDLAKSSNVSLENYTLYPVEHIADAKLEALNQNLGGGLKLFEVDTNDDGKADHVFTFFEGRIINRDGLDPQDLESSLRINEIRLDNQIQSSFQKLCGDFLSRDQLMGLIKSGKEVGITGFSPTEGAIPGSSFERFLGYFKGHSNLFITGEGKISTDQMKIFEAYQGQIIDQARLEDILFRTHDLPWSLDGKMAIAEAMHNPANPEIIPQLFGKDMLTPSSRITWVNNHTMRFDGLLNGKGKLIMDLSNPKQGIIVPYGFMNALHRPFGLDQVKEALNFLRDKKELATGAQ